MVDDKSKLAFSVGRTSEKEREDFEDNNDFEDDDDLLERTPLGMVDDFFSQLKL